MGSLLRVLAVTVLAAGLLACRGEETGSPGGGTGTSATTGPSPSVTQETTSTAAPATTTDSTAADTTATGSTATTPSSTTSTTLPPLRALAYREVAAVDFPTLVTARPGDAVALLAERGGIIHRLEDGEVGEVILDLSGRTTVEGERGLLGLARHPTDDGRLFVHYTDTSGDTVVSGFSLGDDLAGDEGSERVLLTVDQPASNHNGGMIQFGPDGALYLGLGDGGGAGDRFGNGQNRDTLLGGLVRIDVESGSAELWQHGLRNPWRFWIDNETIWIGDVGQSSYEEINRAPVTEEGINYGWPILEGTHCYQRADCDTSGLRLPLVEIARGDGGACSVTGGVVYRGEEIPELDGRFLFSDYCGGFLRSADGDGNVEDHTDQVGVAGQVVSFGVDGQNEVYVLTVDRVLRLVAER
ncbi:MAG: PQQ-dependent sugar dehydrogenase [Actinomycetota bacterium]